MTALDILTIGPFPRDEAHVEGGIQASLLGLGRHLVVHPDIARLRVVATPKKVGGGIERGSVAGIETIWLDAPWKFQVSSVARVPMVIAMLRASPGSVVHLHGSGLFELAVMLACRVLGLPLVWTLHGIVEKELRDALAKGGGLKARLRFLLHAGCERAQLKLARLLIVDTRYVAREVEDRAAVRPSPIPQGIDFAEFAAAREAERPAPTLVSVGVVHPRKGHDRTIAAFAIVAAKMPEARLEIIGSLASAGHLDELNALVARFGLEDRVAIRTDAPRAAILEALARAQAFVLHSQEESQGIALCEAMAAGLPLVATRVGGIPDVIGETDAGVLVDFDDVTGFAAAIVDLLGDGAKRARMQAAAITRGQDFDWSNIVRGVIERYRLARDGRINRREPLYPDVRAPRGGDPSQTE